MSPTTRHTPLESPRCREYRPPAAPLHKLTPTAQAFSITPREPPHWSVFQPPCIGRLEHPTATMPSTLRATTAYAAHTVTLLSLLTASAMGHSWAEDPHAIHVNRLEKRAPPGFIGCFSSSGSLDSLGSYTYQASGYCLEQCAGQAITALTGGDPCLCGAEAPSLADKVDTAKCSTNCNGYPQEKCTCCLYMCYRSMTNMAFRRRRRLLHCICYRWR